MTNTPGKTLADIANDEVAALLVQVAFLVPRDTNINAHPVAAALERCLAAVRAAAIQRGRNDGERSEAALASLCDYLNTRLRDYHAEEVARPHLDAMRQGLDRLVYAVRATGGRA